MFFFINFIIQLGLSFTLPLVFLMDCGKKIIQIIILLGDGH